MTFIGWHIENFADMCGICVIYVTYICIYVHWCVYMYIYVYLYIYIYLYMWLCRADLRKTIQIKAYFTGWHIQQFVTRTDFFQADLYKTIKIRVDFYRLTYRKLCKYVWYMCDIFAYMCIYVYICIYMCILYICVYMWRCRAYLHKTIQIKAYFTGWHIQRFVTRTDFFRLTYTKQLK